MSRVNMSKEVWARLNGLEQTPPDSHNELTIYKNDPKNGQADYWGASYGRIFLTDYYSLKALLIDLDKECLKNGYYN